MSQGQESSGKEEEVNKAPLPSHVDYFVSDRYKYVQIFSIFT